MSGRSKLRWISCVFAISAVVNARVGTIDVVELAKQSQLIVVGEVSAVQTVGKVRVASVKTLAFVKGRGEYPIAFVAEPTWRCDISTAIVGERVLLYLSPIKAGVGPTKRGQDLASAITACKRKGTMLYTLSHSGRGRIPLKGSGSWWTARVKVGPNTAPQLNINLVLPHSAPVKTAADGSRFVTLEYLAAKSKG